MYSQEHADRLRAATQAARYLQQGAAEASLVKPLCAASYALQARFGEAYQAAAAQENGYLSACIERQRRNLARLCLPPRLRGTAKQIAQRIKDA